ncbi:MAG: SMP-30/gluconolactonase/LRE family protein [Acidimicrobiia bacterium]|nr:MAG: SMP-30/gluconolactonase/LRE family protein [Acidimicrobiia bacterium]
MEVGDFTDLEIFMSVHATRVVASGLSFTECPRWHDGLLWFSDMGAPRRVATIDPTGHIETVVHVPNAPGGLGFLDDGSLLVVSMEDRRLLRFDQGRLEEVADLSGIATWHANDLVVDVLGRAYVSNFGFDFLGGAPPIDATLAVVAPSGEVSAVADGIEFANGMVITPDGRTLIVAETLGGRLTAFDRAPDGALSGRRIFCELPDFSPDGICLDAEGAVWAGSIFHSEFVRVLEGGEVTDRVPVPGKWAVACMLGGRQRTTLYLCTVATSMAEMLEGKSEGFIETTEVAVPGAGLP